MVEVKDAFESYRCLVFLVRSGKSGDTGAVLQRSFATGCHVYLETGQTRVREFLQVNGG